MDLYIHEHMPALSAKANFPRGHDYDSALSAPRQTTSPSGKKASEYYGITRQGKRWKARILRSARLGLDSKQLDLGSYPTELEAARAVDLYIHEHMPSLSAKANFPAGHVYGIAPSAPIFSSKYYGVSRYRRDKWQAQIRLGKKLDYDPPKTKNIGLYATELAAAQAVDAYIYANVPKAIPKVNFPRDD